ncbi:hypothetical protein A2154_03065 [Candidatus Gottesmanbacteria bacterium RBG_16_43_7]|uniref:Chloramphenicol acetyltransferase n=1 Tax=Candidatus Gottesmanbacteria bacterium RBG_16_43_7 TaxID=1798373 RepID=A0A1F5ZAY3_9BACT|nr:MAG: hypothetical protein A2154_03065 [Candidatus Gottesmanbacteria bacterium RBG_16_43_7]
MQLGGTYYTQAELKKFGFKALGCDIRIHSRASIYGAENISLGSHIRIDDFSVIVAGGLLEIGSYVSIHNFCYLAGKYGIKLDDFVTLAPGVKIFSSGDDYLGSYLTGVTVPIQLSRGIKGKVILQKHVIIGARSVILPDCILGDGVSVGAMSLVKSDLRPWGIYAGIPVERIGRRGKKLLKYVHRIKKYES